MKIARVAHAIGPLSLICISWATAAVATIELPYSDIVDERGRDDHVEKALKLDAAAYSSVRKAPAGYKVFRHRVCNKLGEQGQPLTFRWPSAGFRSGTSRPLPGRSCSVHVREVGRNEKQEQAWQVDEKADVLYTTQRAPKAMSTFRNKPDTFSRFAQKGLSIVGQEDLLSGKLVEGKVVSMEAELSDGAEMVQYDIRWGKEMLAVIVALPPQAQGRLEEIQRQIAQQPTLAARSRIASLGSLLQQGLPAYQADRALLLEHFGGPDTQVLFLQHEHSWGGQARLLVPLEGGDGELESQSLPMLSLDNKGEVQTAFWYSNPRRVARQPK